MDRPLSAIGQRRQRRADTRTRGFTLIELLVSLAIVVVLTGLAYTFMLSAQTGVQARNGILEVVEELKLARSYALSQGVQSVFLLQPVAGGHQLQYLAFLDQTQSFNPALPNFAVPVGDQLIDQNTIDASVSFNTQTAYMTALPAPFQSVPATTACTFCDVTGDYVTVVFRSDGSAALGSLPGIYPFGGSFTLAGTNAANNVNGASLFSVQTIVISARTGTVFPYLRFGS